MYKYIYAFKKVSVKLNNKNMASWLIHPYTRNSYHIKCVTHIKISVWPYFTGLITTKRRGGGGGNAYILKANNNKKRVHLLNNPKCI